MVVKNYKLGSLLLSTSGLFLFLCLLIPLTKTADAKDISTDPFVKETVSREKFEPGGEYYNKTGSMSDRGDITDRSGQVTITKTSSHRVGKLLIQSGIVDGQYKYTNDLSSWHPSSVHAPFDNNASASASASSKTLTQEVDVSLKWNALMHHPSNGYDGTQGGGYPVPTGARDEFTFDITGSVYGQYRLSSMDIKKLERSPSIRPLLAVPTPAFNNLQNSLSPVTPSLRQLSAVPTQAFANQQTSLSPVVPSVKPMSAIPNMNRLNLQNEIAAQITRNSQVSIAVNPHATSKQRREKANNKFQRINADNSKPIGISQRNNLLNLKGNENPNTLIALASTGGNSNFTGLGVLAGAPIGGLAGSGSGAFNGSDNVSTKPIAQNIKDFSSNVYKEYMKGGSFSSNIQDFASNLQRGRK